MGASFSLEFEIKAWCLYALGVAHLCKQRTRQYGGPEVPNTAVKHAMQNETANHRT